MQPSNAVQPRLNNPNLKNSEINITQVPYNFCNLVRIMSTLKLHHRSLCVCENTCLSMRTKNHLKDILKHVYPMNFSGLKLDVVNTLFYKSEVIYVYLFAKY